MNVDDRKLINDIHITLGRLDERSANTWREIEEQGRHLVELNGKVVEAVKTASASAAIVAALNEKVSGNRNSINLIWKILIATGVLGGVTGGITGITKLVTG